MASKPPPVIRFAPGQANAGGVSLVRAVPAWIVSGVVHVLLLLLFVLVSLNIGHASQPLADVAEFGLVEDKNEPDGITNPDLGPGLNPENPIAFDVPRIEDMAAPGAVDPSAAVNASGAPSDVPPLSVPAPPGVGDGWSGGSKSMLPGQGLDGLSPGGQGGPALLPGGLAARVSGATREKMLQDGGNKESEAAVANGLLWFAKHQSADGHWSLDQFQNNYRDKVEGNAQRVTTRESGQGIKNDVAGTAFGLLPFLGAGITHKPSSEKRAINYQKTVEGGLKYLMAKQDSKTGDFGGGMYSHGLATIAMCEAYGLTSDPLLKISAQRGIDYIVHAQGPGGGWDYGPNSTRIDTSVGGWQLMALKSGQMAGLNVPTATLKGAEKWLDTVASGDKSGYGYSQGTGESPTMTAVGLLARQYLGWSPRNPALLAGIEKLKKIPPGAAPNMYYYYYATQVMHHMGDSAWDFWNKGTDDKGTQVHPGMRDWLIKKQDNGGKNPAQKGSWDPQGDIHGNVGGRVMMTSLCLLTLEVYYRHLPLYRRDMGFNKDLATGEAK
jgi:hypothetical protein